MKYASQYAIIEAFAPLAHAGFLRKRTVWNRRSADTIFAFSVEKNRWGGERYTCHVGVFLLALDPKTAWVPPHKCHLSVHETRGEIEALLDFGWQFDRTAVIPTFVEQTLLPLADQCATLPGTRAWAREVDDGRMGLIWQIARPLLGLPPPDVDGEALRSPAAAAPERDD